MFDKLFEGQFLLIIFRHRRKVKSFPFLKIFVDDHDVRGVHVILQHKILKVDFCLDLLESLEGFGPLHGY